MPHRKDQQPVEYLKQIFKNLFTNFKVFVYFYIMIKQAIIIKAMSSLNSSKSKNPKSFILQGKILSAFFFISLFAILPNTLKLIWPTLISIAKSLGDEKIWMYVIIGVGSNLASLTINNLFMFYVYLSKNPFLQQFRIAPQVPWPWEKNKQWKQKMIKTIGLVFLNGFVINFCVIYGQSYVHQLQYTYSLQSWPTNSKIFTNFVIFFVYDEIVSYFTHRTFHHPFLYPIHKIHHEYTISMSLTATYAHPIQYIFSNLLSVALSIPLLSLITEVHLVTIVPWIYFRLTQTIEVHCGYEFPWQGLSFLKGKNRASFHDFHHSHNWGTYGSMLNIMDYVMGTDRQYKKYYKIQ